MKRILLFLLLGISSHLVQSQQYIYIDALNGNDANNGSTEALAKKTFSYVNTRVLAAGTQVLLKKGCVWNQRLEVRGRGTADNWISVGSYGTATAKPIIRLTNHKDDIALLICDLDRTSGTVRSQNMSYVEIKDIQIENTRIGIYWRNVMTTDNTGFRVKNVTFNNVWCDDVMWTVYNSTNRPTETANQLSAIKGNLQTTTGLTNGGVKEYYFPTAIRIGGIPKNTGGVGLTVNGINYTVLRELEISDCQFNNCLEGIGVGFYHYLASGQGANVWRQTFHKLKFSNCTATGVVNGMYSLDAVNCGAVVGPGGAIQPDANGWGLIKNMQVLEGSSTLPRTSWTGTTGVMLNNTQLLLIDSCLYQNMKNMGNPDGCGFDFETNNDRITLQRTRFFTNDGHSILLMNGGNFGGNTNIVIQNNLFSGNIVSGDSQHELNFSRKEDGHANVQVRNNIFFMRKLNRNNQSISLVDPTRTYVTSSGNTLFRMDPKAPTNAVNFLGQIYNIKAERKLIYQGENGLMGGPATISSNTTASEGKCVGNFNATGAYVQWSHLPASDTIRIAYLTASPTTKSLYVNNRFIMKINCTQTNTWTTVDIPVLIPDASTVKIQRDADDTNWTHIEYIIIWPSVSNTNTSIESITKKGFRVYPNPATDNFTIDFDEKLLFDNNSYLTLFDGIGRLILKQKIQQNEKLRISTEHLKRGLYLIFIETGHHKVNQKLLIQ